MIFHLSHKLRHIHRALNYSKLEPEPLILLGASVTSMLHSFCALTVNLTFTSTSLTCLYVMLLASPKRLLRNKNGVSTARTTIFHTDTSIEVELMREYFLLLPQKESVSCPLSFCTLAIVPRQSRSVLKIQRVFTPS